MKIPNPSRGPRVTEVQTQEFKFPNAGNARPSSQANAPGAPQASFSVGGQPLQSRAPLQTATPSLTEKDPSYISIQLPSKFSHYPFDSIAAKPLQGIHIAKLNRAHKESRLRFLVEAIGATLEPGRSAFDLKPADFYFLMYWQRVTSYQNNKFLVETSCTDEKHNDEVLLGIKGEDGEYLKDEAGEVIKKSKDTLRITEFLTHTTLTVKDYEPFDMTPFKELDEKYQLGYETMKDVVELTEYIIDSKDGAVEFTYLAGIAAYLAPINGRETLAKRCEVVGTMSPEELALMEEYISNMTNFGVSETATLRCKECGGLTRVPVSFDPLMFLPGGR